MGFLLFWVGLSPVGILENVSADGLVFIIGYRFIVHEWIWDTFKKKPPWAFNMTASGWSFSGNGQNPLETINTMINDIFNPKPISLDERIDRNINKMIDKTTDKIIERMLTNKNIQQQIQRQVYKKIKQRLEKG